MFAPKALSQTTAQVEAALNGADDLAWNGGGAIDDLVRSADAGGVTAVNSAEQLEFGFVQNVERQTFARDFYRSATSWSDSDIWSHMQGINFDQPVAIVQVFKGTRLVQYKFPTRPTGNYFAYLGTPALGLGINPAGRVGVAFTVSRDLKALQSTASDTRSLFNVPPWARGPGGNKQLYIPDSGGVAPD